MISLLLLTNMTICDELATNININNSIYCKDKTLLLREYLLWVYVWNMIIA